MTTTQIQGFDATLAAEIEYVVEHLEGNHADTVYFIATQRDEPGSMADAAVAAVDPTGVTFALVPDGGGDRHDCRFEFESPIQSVTELQGQMRALLATARSARPDHPMTSIEQEFAASATLVTWTGSVSAVRSVAPNFIELTISGLDGMPALGGDEFFYVLAPQPGRELAVPGGAKMSEIQALGDEDQPVGAYYTTRRRRPDQGEVDIWVLLHGHDSGVSGWAASARVGDRVAMWGPRRGYEPPATTTSHLLVCDETGLPAAAAIIESLPADHPITLVAEVIDVAHELRLPGHAGLSVHWSHRALGSTSDLAARVRDLDLDPNGLYAFGAAESREISAVRRYLRSHIGMAADQVHMTGYWRSDRD